MTPKPAPGGAPAVWNSAMLVFQALLLGGYAYAHFLARLKPRLRRGTHVTDRLVGSFRARRLRIEVAGIIGYADGERIGPFPMVVECVPAAARLLV